MLLFILVLGCSEDKKPQSQSPIVEQVSNWCEGALGGFGGQRSWQHDAAHAHVGFRLFGPAADWKMTDEVLSDVLLGIGDSADWLPDYAASFDDTCYIEVTGSAGPSQVEQYGVVTVLTPGSDIPTLPAETEHILIDLRSAAFDADIIGAAGLAFGTDQALASKKVRRFLSFPSQEDGWTHYESGQRSLDLSLTALGTSDIPISFLTGPRLSPEASLVVSSLRVQQKAQILGYDVFPAIAESTWTGIEEHGLLWRSSELSLSEAIFPDRIPADAEVATIEEALELLDGADITAVDEPVTRTPFGVYERVKNPILELGDGERRAALLIAYGTLDWFYPYFETVGRDIDTALLDEWLELDTLSDGDRTGMMAVLGRLMHSIHDGHGFYSDWGTTDWPDGYLGIQIERVNGEAVVRSSVHPDINAGDTIVGVEGQTAEAWYAEAMSRYSASSDWYRFVQASYELKEVYGSRTLTLRSITGEERTVDAGPQSYNETLEVPWGGTMKESGWLDDMNAPDLFYVNMSGMVTPEMSTITNQFDDVMTASGVILDMRDYPYLDIYEFARRFNPEPFTAPHFGFPTYTGPALYDLTFEIWSFNAGSTVYTGPIVLMVSNKSVSAAECFAQMLVPLDNVTVVGQTSATTNGTITNAWLPGELQITWTGMDLRNLDGSDFHSIGIVPDEVVVPTAIQFSEGEDPELERAIQVLTD